MTCVEEQDEYLSENESNLILFVPDCRRHHRNDLDRDFLPIIAVYVLILVRKVSIHIWSEELN